MSLRQQIKSDLTRAMKEKDDVRKDALRVVLGELARQNQFDCRFPVDQAP